MAIVSTLAADVREVVDHVHQESIRADEPITPETAREWVREAAFSVGIELDQQQCLEAERALMEMNQVNHLHEQE